MDMVSFPFINVVISAEKPRTAGYPDHLETIGDHIRKRRLELGLLQREVAEIIGVPETTVQMWECYGYEPRIRNWPGIIFFLGCEPFPPPTTMAEKVKAIRRRLGLTNRELAQRIQADPGAITRWEAGGAIRKEQHRRAIAELCQTQYLLENYALLLQVA